MHSIQFKGWRALLGTGICAMAASAIALLFRNRPLEPVVPLFFLAVIAIVAMRFGAAAGLVGSIGATTVFAMLLFQPLGSLTVANLDERSNLTWMYLIGFSLSFLLDNIAPHDLSRLIQAVKMQFSRSVALHQHRRAIDKTLLALLVMFAAVCLLILWWVLRHPVPIR